MASAIHGPRPQPSSPPKWKTALLTAAGLYPLVLLLFPFLADRMAGWAPWLSKLLTLLLAVPLMTWGVLPVLSWMLQRWLYAPRSEEKLSQSDQKAELP